MTETPPPRRKYSLFPKTLASCVEPQLRPILKAQGLAGSRILTEWKSIVGTALASHCIPEKLAFPPGKKTGGTLTIAAENGFATELQHMQPVILERLATYFGYKAVSRISISHSYPAQEKKPDIKKTSKPHPRIDTASLDTVEDSELKSALASFAQTLSE